MKQIDELIDGYFEGTLSRREEHRLKAFLASRKGQAPEYDQIRAVVSYYATGKSLDRATSYERPMWMMVAAAAACLAMAAFIGIRLYNNSNSICVAYVDGVKITDREVVMNGMEDTLSDLLSSATDVEDQLNDFFGE